MGNYPPGASVLLVGTIDDKRRTTFNLELKMSKRLDTRLNNSGHVIEQISAYLDGALDDVASDRVDAHLTGCAQCRAEYTEVRATRQLLRNTVTVPPPRAFTLTEEMIGRKRWSWGRLLVPRNVPRLLSGSAAVFALVAILFVIDLSNLGTRQHAVFSSASAPVLKQAASADRGPAYDTVAPTPGGSEDSQASGSVAEGTVGSLSAVPMSTSMAANSANVQATTTAGVSSGLRVTATEAVPQVATRVGSDKLQSQLPTSNSTPQIMDAFTSPTATGYLDASETRGSAPDGGRILLFSVEGLLVALGAVLALGAVFAARK